jgi:uncharacterized protein
MKWLKEKLALHPALPRAVPFAVFLLLTGCQAEFGEASKYWFYLAKTVVGAWLLWEARSLIPELKWSFSVEAVLAGLLVLGLWIGLEGQYPKWQSEATPWNPHTLFGQGTALAWFFVAVRLLGSSLLVPMLEEVFFRSFMYRFVASGDFLNVPLNRFLPVPFLATAAVFASEHLEWLPGLLCGFIYQGLVIRKGRLGDAITAHAITNFLLGLYVVWKEAWLYW